MPKPTRKYDPSKHHMPVETHPLPPRIHIALAQIDASIVAMKEAKAHVLMDAASNDWGYPTGKELTFDPNYENGTVIVTMKDVKSVDKPNSKES